MTPSDDDRRKAWTAFAFFACLMTGYYFIKPVRDAVFIHRKTYEALPAYYLVVAGAGLVLVYAYNLLVNVLSRRALLLAVYGTFVALVAYSAVRLAGGAPGPAAAFFVELSLFNFLLVGVFWTAVNDVFGVESGRRWYGLVGLGGPVGALAGSLGALALAQRLGSHRLLWISMPFFAAALAAGLRLDALGRRSPPADTPRVTAGAAHLDFGVVFRSRYALLIAGGVVAAMFVTSIYSLAYSRLLGARIAGEDAKTAWNAGRMLWENGLGLAVQLLVTPVLLRRGGPGAALWVQPALMIGAGVLLAAVESLTAATMVLVMSGGVGYTLNQSAKEVLYVPCDRSLKYKAKAVIDVFGARLGIAAASLAVMGGFAFFSDSFQPFLILAAGVSVAWLGFAREAGRAFDGAVQAGPERVKLQTPGS